MRILTYVQAGVLRLGIHTEAGVLDVEHALELFGHKKGTDPLSLQELITGDPELLDQLGTLAAQAARGEAASVILLDESSLELAPCVPAPGKIICVGFNYRKHAEETSSPIPQTPILFSKFNNALAAHLESVPLPAASQKIDYEAELVIVIGRTARNVAQEEAFNHVFGYCCGNLPIQPI